MVKELEISNNERQFILKAIIEGYRIDNRKKSDFRKLNISFGQEFGKSEVTLGSTRVLAKVSCQVTRPYQDRPSEGILILNSELSQMAFPNFEIGRPEEVLVNRILEKAIKRSRAIDTEGLCILAGEKAIDIHFIDNDGNIIDAACIAAISALSHFRRPDVTVIGQDVTIVNPTLQEEQTKSGDMTITLNDHKEIFALSKAGGVALEIETIKYCTKIATTKVNWLAEQIKLALEKDNEKR
nr:14712_t:CDS:2 [Entrophospora candida]